MSTTTNNSTNDKSKMMGIGALLAGIGASLCCTLPLAATFFGFSLFAGASAFFDSIRPYFLTAAFLLLALGYYQTFVRNRNSDIECDCDDEDEMKRKRNFRNMLYFLTVATFAFAFYPQWSNSSKDAISGTASQSVASLAIVDIEGMTCDDCAHSIQTAVTRLDGIIKADVSFATKIAVVYFAENSLSGEKEVRDAITNIGYTVKKYENK